MKKNQFLFYKNDLLLKNNYYFYAEKFCTVMKDTRIYIMLVFAVAFSVVFQSCGTSIGDSITLTKSRIESRLAYQGELLMDNMIESYRQLQDIKFDNDFDGALAGVLSDNGAAYEPTQLMDEVTRKKLNVLFLYKQGLHEYALLSDEGFTGKQTAFANCGKSIIEAFKGLDSAAYNEVLPVNNYIKSSRYDENKVAALLSGGLGVMWNKDVIEWHQSVEQAFADYQAAISSIPDEAFNEEKLLKYVEQPYEGKHKLAEVYKLNLIKGRRDVFNSFEERIDNVTTALHYLGLALSELQKTSYDKDVVLNYTSRIKVLLNDESVHEDHE